MCAVSSCKSGSGSRCVDLSGIAGRCMLAKLSFSFLPLSPAVDIVLEMVSRGRMTLVDKGRATRDWRRYVNWQLLDFDGRLHNRQCAREGSRILSPKYPESLMELKEAVCMPFALSSEACGLITARRFLPLFLPVFISVSIVSDLIEDRRLRGQLLT